MQGIKTYDGSGKKVPTVSEQDERLWRVDPIDGLCLIKQLEVNFRKSVVCYAEGSNKIEWDTYIDNYPFTKIIHI